MSLMVRFDDSLDVLVRLVVSELGTDVLDHGVVLRDSAGRLAFFTSAALEEPAIARTTDRLRKELGGYARSDGVVFAGEDSGAKQLAEDRSALTVERGGHRLRFVDRRLVGADWLRQPAAAAPPPPRFVFASLKGGVGRSTALTVVAAHLAARGRRVLAVDLDMEAPGLGSLLLTEDTMPEFGVLDALVEDNISGLDAAFLADLVGPSSLADKAGRVDVIPAFGRRSLRNPADILAKIARAYAEYLRPDGSIATILDHVASVIERFSDPARYDAILIDARAGLHETTASAVLGLGADVLLFGVDEAQTFQGYAAMLAHLARFIPRGGPLPEWAERLTMVHAKAPIDPDERANFAQKCQTLFVQAGILPTQPEEAAEVLLPGQSFKNVPWNDDVPDEEILSYDWMSREPLIVLEDPRYQRFDPFRRRDLLVEEVYRSTFGSLLERLLQGVG